MPRVRKFNPAAAKDARAKTGLNQTAYWNRFGVTQSGGSRYESGRAVPRPTALLMWLRETGRITDKDLADAMKATAKA